MENVSVENVKADVLENGSVENSQSVENAETELAVTVQRENKEQIPTKDILKQFILTEFDTHKMDKVFKRHKGMSRTRLRAIFAEEVPVTEKYKKKVEYDDGTSEVVDAIRVVKDDEGNTIYQENPAGKENRKIVLGTITKVRPKLVDKCKDSITDLFADFRRGRGKLDMETIMASLELELV